MDGPRAPVSARGYAATLPMTLPNFTGLFGRPCRMQAAQLLRALPEHVAKYISHKAKQLHLPALSPDGNPWPWEDVLCAGDRSRLLGYQRWFRKHRQPETGCANINQTCKFSRGPSLSGFPALLTRAAAQQQNNHKKQNHDDL